MTCGALLPVPVTMVYQRATLPKLPISSETGMFIALNIRLMLEREILLPRSKREI